MERCGAAEGSVQPEEDPGGRQIESHFLQSKTIAAYRPLDEALRAKLEGPGKRIDEPR
ncbi:MAG: hypothetical protein K9J83_02995 [Desulfarculaceae bacterium]|nr:hypothetical protein [Desulfarculaceae bacterium]